MNSTLEPETVAKSLGRPKTSDRDDVTVKLDRAVAAKAKAVAAHKGSTQAEVLSEAARVGVDKEYARMLRELDASGR